MWKTRKDDRYLFCPKEVTVSRIPKTAFLFFLAAALASCHTILQPKQLAYSGYTISETHSTDSTLNRMLQPYRDSLALRMSAVVGHAAGMLEKAKPSGSLGNFMADAALHMARQQFARSVDFALVNYGGIRLTQLPMGPVTRGKIFELMPFENELVLQVLTGAQVQQLSDHIAVQGGWPVAGITFNIRNKKATDIVINGKPLNLQQSYTIALSDYVANGGDNTSFLTAIPQVNKGYLLRDALFDYVSLLQQQRKQIEVSNEQRINDVQ